MTSLKHKLLFTLILLQTIAAAGLILSFYVWQWPFELVVSFTQQLTIVYLVSLVTSSLLVLFFKNYKRNLPLLAVTGVAWLAGLFILFYSLNAQPSIDLITSEQPTITFATFNKLYDNHDDDRYIEYVKQQDVDILVLQEVTSDEVTYVAEQLGFEYSYSSRTFATSGGRSVGIVSRYPFESVATIELATEHPIARAVVETPEGRKAAVYAVHIPVPSSNFLYNKRNIVLKSLAETLRDEDLQTIVAGDFNTTIYSPAMRTFSSATNSALKPVATKVWPDCSWYGYGPAMCVRIDHVFVSKDAEITDFTIAPDLGSDHRALITKIILPPQ